MKNQDIYIMKDDQKFYIQDLEQTAIEKVKQKELKRKHHETFGYGSGEDIDSDSDDDLRAGQDAKKRVRVGDQGNL